MTTLEGAAKAAGASELASTPAQERARSTGYRIYATCILGLVYALAAADKGIVSILLVPIQKDLGVSDLAMGSLAGAAFTIVHATAVLPLALLADRRNRRNIIAIAVTFWSVMTAVSGMATSFLTLLLARIGVAAGEAGNASAILSSVSDLHPRSRRGIGYGALSAGAALGGGGGSFAVGLLSQNYGWRMAFFAMSVPGLITAAVIFLTMVEPRRGAYEAPAAPKADLSAWEAIRYILGVPTMRRILIALIVMQGTTAAFMAWMPAFLMRVHHLTVAEMSAGWGFAIAGGSLTSSLIAGTITDKLSKRGEKWRLFYCSIGLVIGAPILLVSLYTASTPLSLVTLFIAVFCAGGVTASSTAAYLGVVRPEVRGRASAIVAIVIAIIGLSVGPSLFGAINDWLKPTYGVNAVRYTLLSVPPLWLVAASLFIFAGKTADEDAALAEGHEGAALPAE